MTRGGRSGTAPVRSLALIPARRGSKGLPGKNRLRIGGSSLVELAIALAGRTGVCDLCAVTSDDPLLLAQAERAGAIPIVRPAHLATDRSPTMDAVIHAVAHIEAQLGVHCDPIVLLEPTAPLRRVGDVRTAVARNRLPGRPNVVGLSRVGDSEWLCRLGAGGRVIWDRPGPRHTRRQDQAARYVPNSIVYVLTRGRLHRPWSERVVGFETDRYDAIEIDDAADLAVARALAGRSRVRGGRR